MRNFDLSSPVFLSIVGIATVIGSLVLVIGDARCSAEEKKAKAATVSPPAKVSEIDFSKLDAAMAHIAANNLQFEKEIAAKNAEHIAVIQEICDRYKISRQEFAEGRIRIERGGAIVRVPETPPAKTQPTKPAAK